MDWKTENFSYSCGTEHVSSCQIYDINGGTHIPNYVENLQRMGQNGGQVFGSFQNNHGNYDVPVWGYPYQAYMDGGQMTFPPNRGYFEHRFDNSGFNRVGVVLPQYSYPIPTHDYHFQQRYGNGQWQQNPLQENHDAARAYLAHGPFPPSPPESENGDYKNASRHIGRVQTVGAQHQDIEHPNECGQTRKTVKPGGVKKNTKDQVCTVDNKTQYQCVKSGEKKCVYDTLDDLLSRMTEVVKLSCMCKKCLCKKRKTEKIKMLENKLSKIFKKKLTLNVKD